MSNYTATITATQYQAEIVSKSETPLGVTSEQAIPVDQLVVTIDVGPLEGHEIIIPAEAIENRRVGYGLSDPLSAVEAIVREHVFRMGALAPPPPAEVADDDAGVVAQAETFGFVLPDVVEVVAAVPATGPDDESVETTVEVPATAADKAVLARELVAHRLDRIARNGGLDERITVNWTAEARAALADALAAAEED